MGLLILYLSLVLIVSFICSIMESVLLSLPASYLTSQLENGIKSAELMLIQKENIDKPLSAILSLNTIAHTVGAAGVGAQATILFGDVYFGLVSAILTILILVVTEIIPKTLGANYAKELMGISASIINAMIFITYPIVLTSSFLTKVLSRKDNEPTTSREEVSALANIGTDEGIFEDNENKIIQNLIRLKDIKVSEVMTPRVVVITASEDMTLQEFMDNKEFLHFSRIPIFKENKDNITGYILRSMVFEKLAEDQFEVKLKDIKRNILTFPETVTLFQAWEEMLSKREHLSLIIDEYGGMDGITTLEDIIESLLGFEIVDEKDKVDDMQKYAIKKWRERQNDNEKNQ
ncbi:CNNM domain-containing protein [Psychroflexus planctonicus]|nr:CNNM domain-containing protein [Psychroflexus planctonicus]